MYLCLWESGSQHGGLSVISDVNFVAATVPPAYNSSFPHPWWAGEPWGAARDAVWWYVLYYRFVRAAFGLVQQLFTDSTIQQCLAVRAIPYIYTRYIHIGKRIIYAMLRKANFLRTQMFTYIVLLDLERTGNRISQMVFTFTMLMNIIGFCALYNWMTTGTEITVI